MKEFHFDKHKCLPEDEYKELLEAIKTINEMILPVGGGRKEMRVEHDIPIYTNYPPLAIGKDEETVKNAAYIIFL